MAQMQRILEGAYIEKLADAENKIKSLESKLSPKKLWPLFIFSSFWAKINKTLIIQLTIFVQI